MRGIRFTSKTVLSDFCSLPHKRKVIGDFCKNSLLRENTRKSILTVFCFLLFEGYVYVIFEHERAVKQLLGSCVFVPSEDIQKQYSPSFYYKVSSSKMRGKDVQVIPWQLVNCTYVPNAVGLPRYTKQVFVGSLHGMITAEGLAKVMNDLFPGVVASSLDTGMTQYCCFRLTVDMLFEFPRYS